MSIYTHNPTDYATLKDALETTSAKVWVAPDIVAANQGTPFTGLIQVASNVEVYGDAGQVISGVIRKGAQVKYPYLQYGSWASPPYLLEIVGTGVIIQGLHFSGPWAGPGQNGNGPVSGGIKPNASGYQILNCTFEGFPHSAILCRREGLIRACTFYGNRREGLGYGVWLGNTDVGRVWIRVEACFFDKQRHSTAGSGHEINGHILSCYYGDDHRYTNAENHSSSGIGRGCIERIHEKILFRNGRFGDASNRRGNRNIVLPLPRREEDMATTTGDGLMTFKDIYCAHHQHPGSDSLAAMRVNQVHVESYSQPGPNDPVKPTMTAVTWENLHYQNEAAVALLADQQPGVPEGAVLPEVGVVNYDGATLSVTDSTDPDGHSIGHHILWATLADQGGSFGQVMERFTTSVPLALAGVTGAHKFEVQAVNEPWGVPSDRKQHTYLQPPAYPYGLQVLWQHERFTDAGHLDFVIYLENITQGSGRLEAHRARLTQANLGWNRVMMNLQDYFTVSSNDQIKIQCLVEVMEDFTEEGTNLVFLDGVHGFGFDVNNGWFDDLGFPPWGLVSQGLGGQAYRYDNFFSGFACCELVDIRSEIIWGYTDETVNATVTTLQVSGWGSTRASGSTIYIEQADGSYVQTTLAAEAVKGTTSISIASTALNVVPGGTITPTLKEAGDYGGVEQTVSIP